MRFKLDLHCMCTIQCLFHDDICFRDDIEHSNKVLKTRHSLKFMNKPLWFDDSKYFTGIV